MKRLRIMIPVLFLCFILAGRGETSAANEGDEYIATTGAVEVIKDVYDDLQSTIYIKVKNGHASTDEDVADIVMKKKNWEKRFPNKKIVAMSVVTENSVLVGGSSTSIAGLLIHYEQH